MKGIIIEDRTAELINEWYYTHSISTAYDVMSDLAELLKPFRGQLKIKYKGHIPMNKYDKIANIITGAAAVAFGGYVTADKVKRVGMNKSGDLTNEIIIELEDGRIAKASIHKDFVPEGEFKQFVEYLGNVWRENDKRARKA